MTWLRLCQSAPYYMGSVTTTPTHWAAAAAAAAECHVIHIWSKMLRIQTTYYRSQINSSPYCIREDSTVHAHTCRHTPTTVDLPRSSETVSILTTGFSCG